MVTRRHFIMAGGLALAGLGAPTVARVTATVEIRMHATTRGERVWFDPIGVWVAPGQTVRWVLTHDVHTTTAYHPRNSNHSLRIPEGAAPWDSGYMITNGAHFDVTLTVEGVYDYFCRPHEAAGMVGRIIVGTARGAWALPYDYFQGRPGTSDWIPVPEAAQQAFPSIERILKGRVVRGS